MDNYDSDVQDRGRSGSPFVMIPGEVAFNPDLTKSDMFVFWIIFLFDTNNTRHFFASNAYIAKKLNISEAQATRSITRLKEEGYIKQISFDGRKRVLAIDKNYVFKHEKHIHNFNDDESFSGINNDTFSDPAKKLTLPNTDESDPAKKLTLTKQKSLVYNNKNTSKDSFSKEKENVSEEETFDDKDLSSSLRDNKDSSYLSKNEERINKKNQDNEQELFIINKQVKEIISYWNSKGKPLTVHQVKEDNSTYQNIKTNLIKVLNDQYSTIKIKQSIDHYYDLLVNKETSLKPKVTSYPTSLHLFLKFDSFSLTQIAKYNPDFKIKSWFKECLKSEKELLKKYTVLKQDKNPTFTETLKDKFLDEFNYQRELTPKDENCFIRATEKIFSFVKENDDILPDKFIRQPVKLTRYLFETVKECNKQQTTIYPWYLTQDWLYERALITYMEKINAI